MFSLIRYLIAVTSLFAATTSMAFAYLDPVTGSFIIQGIVGAIAAAMVGIRSFRDKVKNFFNRKNKADE